MGQIHKQCSATVSNAVGRLAEVTEKVKAEGINILALCAWVDGDIGHLLLLADDSDKACAAIQGSVDSCEFQEVVCAKMPNTPGALNEAARKLAEAGIGIDMVYATAADAQEAPVVFATTDNARAAELI